MIRSLQYTRANCLDAPVQWVDNDEDEEHPNEDIRALCSSCVIQTECLSTALELRIEYGVWGGTTAKERHRILYSAQGKLHCTSCSSTLVIEEGRSYICLDCGYVEPNSTR